MNKKDIEIKIVNDIVGGRNFQDYDDINKVGNSDKYIFFLFSKIPQYEVEIRLTNISTNQYIYLKGYPNELMKTMKIYGIPFVSIRFVELIIYKSDFGKWNLEIINLQNQNIIKAMELNFINNEIYTKTNQKISIANSYSGVYIDGLI